MACSLSDQAQGRSDRAHFAARRLPVMSNRMAAKGIAPFAPEGNKRRRCAQARVSDRVPCRVRRGEADTQQARRRTMSTDQHEQQDADGSAQDLARKKEEE